MNGTQTIQINRCIHCMADLEGVDSVVCPKCGGDVKNTDQPDFCLRPFSILHGKYLVGAMLGQGGFGITYVGLDLLLETKVAIKECYPGNLATRNSTMSNRLQWNSGLTRDMQWKAHCASFLREARKMAKMKNIPEVVRVLDTFEENDSAYIVMDFVDGITLKQWLEKNGIVTPEKCLEIMRPVMTALQNVHKQGFIHRDISPDNIMIQPDGSLRLLDLGAAKEVTDSNNANKSALVTKTGFSPLEQYAESGRIGPWTDVYALCATMYYCMTGKMITSAPDRIYGSDLKFEKKHFVSQLPKEMEKALMDGLALDYRERIQSIAELAERLQPKPEPAPVPDETKKSKKSKKNGDNYSANGEDNQDNNTSEKKKSSTDAAKKKTRLKIITTVICLVLTAGIFAGLGWYFIEHPPYSLPGEEERETYYMRYYDDRSPFSELNDDYIIKSVTFKDSLGGKPKDAITVDHKESIFAWVDGTEMIVASEGYIATYNAKNMFRGFTNLERVSFNGNLDISHATSTECMFFDCKSLRSVDFDGMWTDRLTSMKYMFAGCSSLRTVFLNSLGTSKVKDMSYMFRNCTTIKSINLSTFNTESLESVIGMFYNCSSLEKLDISNFTLPEEEENCVSMFSGCDALSRENSNIPEEYVELVERYANGY